MNSAEDVADNWEHIKMNPEKRDSLLSGIPMQAPALLFAQRMQEKASKIGFDWENVEGIIQKIEEEISELKAALSEGDKDKIQEEIGDTIFSIVNISRFLNLNAEDCLRSTNKKFKKRFQYIENYYNGDFDSMKKASLKDLDDLWEKAKNE